MQPYSLYLHIPFCRHRCAYCDFNTYAGLESLVLDYTRALCREIEQIAQAAVVRLPVHTIFFGGGTPSLLPIVDVARILEAARSHFDLYPDAEITLEANPGTVSLSYLQALKALGINRLSIGMQSAKPEELSLLEREHNYFDVVQVVTWARQTGFDNLNLDLIFGLPYQTLADWQHTLELALRLRPDHFSLYNLILEHGTPLQHWVNRGLLPEPDDDLDAEMYEWAMERLEREGYGQYEISNWAQRDAAGKVRSCRHNLQYWYNLPYLGLGAGAHGFAGGYRTANVRAPTAYIKRCLNGIPREFPRTPATINELSIDHLTEMQETMLVGLRLVEEGVSDVAFQRRFEERIWDVFEKEVRELGELGLLEWVNGGEKRLRLTKQGRLLGNQVFMRFV